MTRTTLSGVPVANALHAASAPHLEVDARTNTLTVTTGEEDTAPTLLTNESQWNAEMVQQFTPRSNEALRQLGIDPFELVVRPFEAFAEAGLPRAIQKLRYQDYESERQDLIKKARKQRARLVGCGWMPGQPSIGHPSPNASPLHSGGGSAAVSPAGGLAASLSPQAFPGHSTHRSVTSAGAANATAEAIIHNEEVRIEKALKRQNKELQMLMANEIRTAALLAKQQEQTALRRQKEEARLAQIEQERQEAQLRKLRFEERKREEEELEKQRQREASEAMLEQERRFQDQIRQRELERREEARQRAMQRIIKKRELKERSVKVAQQQQALMLEKQKMIEERDLKRRQALEKAKQELQVIHEQRAEKARVRAELVAQFADKQIEEKRINLAMRMEELRHRKDRMEREKQTIIEQEITQKHELEQKRLEKRKEADMAKHKEAVMSVKERQEAFSESKRKVDEERQMQMLIKHELFELNRHRKEKNLVRQQRMEEYRRAALIDKVNEDARRARLLELNKEEDIRARQKAQRIAGVKRQQLLRTLDRLMLSKNYKAIAETLPQLASAPLLLTDEKPQASPLQASREQTKAVYSASLRKKQPRRSSNASPSSVSSSALMVNSHGLAARSPSSGGSATEEHRHTFPAQEERNIVVLPDTTAHTDATSGAQVSSAAAPVEAAN